MNIMQPLPPMFPAFPEFKPGEVWLVGAGPGDPRLLTMMAAHALRAADTIIHDALIDPRVLGLASPAADVISAGKRGGKPSPHQADINGRVVALARQGRKVVRLKGGDPFVFGRGGEEALALARAGIPFRVVPGLTAGLAAAALAGIPATSRATNHAIILATGHRAVDDRAAREWEALAKAGQPIVLYMSMANLEDIAAAFMKAGMAPDTPATIIAAATFPGERILESRISTAGADARVHGIGAPAIVVIGTIAALRAELVASLLENA